MRAPPASAAVPVASSVPGAGTAAWCSQIYSGRLLIRARA